MNSTGSIKKTNLNKTINTKDIYDRQNRIIHKGFCALGLPYSENKEYWLALCESVCKRTVSGLSGMTLAERRALIGHMKKQNVDVENSFVPYEVRDWKTGDPEQTILYPHSKQGFAGRPSASHFDDPDKGRMLKKIEAMLAEGKRPWAYAHNMSKKMFRVDRIEWCPPKQMHAIVSAMMIDAIRHGRKTKQKNKKEGVEGSRVQVNQRNHKLDRHTGESRYPVIS